MILNNFNVEYIFLKGINIRNGKI